MSFKVASAQLEKTPSQGAIEEKLKLIITLKNDGNVAWPA
jgi:hypothetical protein